MQNVPSLIAQCLLPLVGLLTFNAYAAEPMRVVYYNEYEPISWSASGAMRGVLVDIVDEAIVKRMGVTVVHQGYPWARAQDMVKRGEADAFLTVVTPERKEYTIASEEFVLSLDFTAYISANDPRRKDFLKVKTLADLKPYLIGNYIGNGWAKTRLAEHRQYLVPRMSSVLNMLGAQRVDMFVDGAQVVRYNIHKLNLDDAIVELPPIFETAYFRLCVGKTSAFSSRIAQFDEVIRAMRKDGTMDKIYNKYKILAR